MAIKQTPIYSDLDLRMVPHPLSGDLLPVTNMAAIKQSLRNIFFLDRFDIPFDGDLHSGLKKILFEQANQLTMARLRSQVEWVVGRLEPRVKLERVDILDFPDSNGYQITLFYTIKSIMTQDKFEFFVQRVR